MKISEALALIHQRHHDFSPRRIEEVLCSLIDFQASPGASAIIPFDPEKCPVAEATLFLLSNHTMLKLCQEPPGKLICQETIVNCTRPRSAKS